MIGSSCTSCEFYFSPVCSKMQGAFWGNIINEIYRYHHLNHYAIFGGGYRGGAVRIMENLIAKYGKGRDGT